MPDKKISSVPADDQKAESGEEKQEKPSKPALTIARLASILDDAGITVRLNQISRQIEIQGFPTEFDPENITNDFPAILHDQLKTRFSMASVSTIQDMLSVIAGVNRINPVHELLWSGNYCLGQFTGGEVRSHDWSYSNEREQA